MRNLKTINEEFVILNRYQEMLTKKKEQIENIPDKKEELEQVEQDIKVVVELLHELQVEINEWASKQNESKNESKEEKEQDLREKFESLKQQIKEIKNHSKSLQPKITSTDKKRKDEILKQAGFVETTTVDYRKILIHPQLVGKYHDLVKEQRLVSAELSKEYREQLVYEEQQNEDLANQEEMTNNIEEEMTNNIESEKLLLEEKDEIIKFPEEEQTNEQNNPQNIDEEIQHIESQIQDILKNGRGKKMFVKYSNEKYYLPKSKRGKFLSLMRELEHLKSAKRLETYIQQLNSEEYSKQEQNEIFTEALKEQKRLLTKEEREEAKKTMPSTDEETRKNLYAGMKLAQTLGGYNPEIPEEEIKQEEFTTNFTSQKNNETSIYDISSEEQPSYTYDTPTSSTNFEQETYSNIQNESERDISSVISEKDKDSKENQGEKIINIRKPKFKNKIKKTIKKLVPIIIATIIAVTGIKISLKHKKSEQPKEDTNIEYQESTNKEIYGPEEQKIDDYLNSLNDQTNTSEENQFENEKTMNIGSSVSIEPGSHIYKTAKDANLEENPFIPYFNNSEEERTILGLSISINNQIINITAHDINAQEEINLLLNNGGKIESVLVGNKAQEQTLKNYKGSRLNADDINNYCEGWYNINSITNMKGNNYQK